MHPVYLDRVSSGYTYWPVSPLVDGVPDIENVTEALKVGSYGKCVYESDNDVADNQVNNTISNILIEAHTHLTITFTTRSLTWNSPQGQHAPSP